MSTRKERKAKAQRRLCRNCGEKGPHFVPPGFGDPGFCMCRPKSPTRAPMPDDTQGTKPTKGD